MSVFTILLLMVAIVFLLRTEKMQNFLLQKGASYLSERLKTKVDIAHVKISFFNGIHFQQIFIADQQKDTLAYIGDIEIRTTELLANYWRKQTPILQHLNISDAYVNLYREKDSIWNYAFIENALSSSTSSSEQSVQEEKPKDSQISDPLFDLRVINCQRIRFIMRDGWRGEDMIFAVNKLTLQSKNLQKGKHFSLEDILIDKANIVVKEYEGYKPEDLTPDDTSKWGTPFNPDQFTVSLKKVQLRNTSFQYTDGDEKPLPYEFDEKHMIVKDIQLTLENTSIQADTIFTQMKHFSAKERCGLEIKKMSGNIALSQVQTIINQLKLQTNHSTLTDRYEMHYQNFHDFDDYINKVLMHANLVNTSISSIDIAYFANTLEQYPIALSLSGEIHGTVNDLQGKNLSIETRNSIFKGDAKVKGLPDLNTTFFDVDIHTLQTSGKDMNALIPATKVDAIHWNKLDRIQYSGKYTGHIDDFTTKGTLLSNLGNAQVDIAMNFNSSTTKYVGEIETENFDIGTLLQEVKIGKISMKGKIEGSGFDLKDVNTKMDATISKIEADGNIYSDITINGILQNKKFDGIFISRDSNLAINFNGKLDLSKTQPVYNFNSRFIRFNLQKLGLSKEPLIASGVANLQFEGSTIDNFIGAATFKNLQVSSKGKSLLVQDVLIASTKDNTNRTLSLKSNIADAEINGNFLLSELPIAIRLYLHHYLPQYIQLPKKRVTQELTFSATVKANDSFIHYFLPGYHGLAGTYISGGLNTNTQLFSLDANIPQFGYNEFTLQDIAIVGAGDYKEFDINLNAGNLLYHNDVMIPSFQMNGMMASDTASLSIVTQSINDLLGDASLNVKATALNNNLYVTILPSTIQIKQDKWQIQSSDQLVFGNIISIKNVMIESGAQKITIHSKENNANDLMVEFDELDAESFCNYLNQTEPTFYGRMSGSLDIQSFTTNPFIVAEMHSTNILRMNQDTLGFVQVNASYDVSKQIVEVIRPSSLKRDKDEASVVGLLNLKDSTIQMQANVNNWSIAFLNPFLSDYIKNLQGFSTGEVTLKGRLANPSLKGNLRTENIQCKVVYLGTTYKTKNLNLNLTNEIIQAEPFYLTDERGEKFSCLVNGNIRHKNFYNLTCNMTASGDNFLVLNTNEWDNDLFYGFVPAKMNATVKGSFDDITLDIDAQPVRGASFHMPIGSSGDASTYDYIEFKQYGKDQELLKKKKNANYFKINMNIEATPAAEVFIILDKNTGEEIAAKGNGNIKLTIDMGNSMNMFGKYIISEGKYNFNFRGVFPRVFTIDEGSNIQWNGDPLQAKLDVKAIYKVPKKLDLYPLIAGLTDDEVEKSQAKQTYETFISLDLQGELSSPEIKFDINQPDNKSIGSMAYDKLVQIKNDENELVSQAGVLLLFGEFKGTNPIGSGTYERGGFATASDLIGDALSSGLTNVFSEITGLNNINLNVGYKTLAASAEDGNRNQFNFGVSANLFKDRVIVDFGSNIDVDRNATSKASNTVNIGGDFRAQYLATEDGRLRLNAFRTSNYNAEGVNVTKGGFGVSYKKVFNTIGDFFTSKKRKAKLRQQENDKKTDS
jgi:hypothetical protein